MKHRITGIAAGVALASTAGALSVTAATAGASAARATHAKVAVARPLAKFIDFQWAQPPTTEQCVEALGLACYDPAQFQAAYDLGPLYKNGLNGKGKTVVIADSFGSPTIRSDLKSFDKAFKLPAPPSFKILQPVGKVPPFNPNGPAFGWAVETSLDVEMAHAMAPGASIVLLETPVAETEGTVGFPQLIAAENYAINHHLGDVITQSFGATEQTFPSINSILRLRSAYKNAYAHHVTVLASTGDYGATDPEFNGTTLYTHRVVAWPATDPLVTAVGGLQLHLNQQGQRTLPDNVWNDTNLFGSPASGGGGVSTVFARPSYQNGVRKIVGLHRGVPDISLSAASDGAALTFLSFPGLPAAGFYLVSGTSEASPQFAGIVSILDQALGHDAGLLGPTLYQLAAGKSPIITDVTRGNNTVTFSQHGRTVTVKGYNAVAGYDLASGLGGIDAGAALVGAIAHRHI